MNDIQEKLMQLMDEIVEFCQKNDLHYILFGQTAARAQKNKAFKNSTYEFQIMMSLPDIYRLQTAVEKSLGSIRTFESWKDNVDLPQMVFRYTDKESLIIDGWEGIHHTKPGIAVTIFAARTKRPSSKILGCERYLQMYNEGRSKSFWATITFAKALRKIVGKARTEKILHIDNLDSFTSNTGKLHAGGLRVLVHRREKLGQYVVENQTYCSDPSKTKRLWFLRKDGKLVTLPRNLFSSTRQIRFEGRKFYIPKKLNKYLEILFGDNWKTKAYETLPISNRPQVIRDSKMPYEKYLVATEKEGGASFSDMARYWTEYNHWKEIVYIPAKTIKDHDWNRIKRSVDRIDVWYLLKPKREAIKIAYEAKDIDQLKILLDEYLDKTDQYAVQGIGFYIDSELFDCAKLVWEADGKPDYADQVYDLVPELYKNETVDEYLASRGVTVD